MAAADQSEDVGVTHNFTDFVPLDHQGKFTFSSEVPSHNQVTSAQTTSHDQDERVAVQAALAAAQAALAAVKVELAKAIKEKEAALTAAQTSKSRFDLALMGIATLRGEVAAAQAGFAAAQAGLAEAKKGTVAAQGGLAKAKKETVAANKETEAAQDELRKFGDHFAATIGELNARFGVQIQELQKENLTIYQTNKQLTDALLASQYTAPRSGVEDRRSGGEYRRPGVKDCRSGVKDRRSGGEYHCSGVEERHSGGGAASSSEAPRFSDEQMEKQVKLLTMFEEKQRIKDEKWKEEQRQNEEATRRYLEDDSDAQYQLQFVGRR